MAEDAAVLMREPADGVRLITLNRPEHRNAMTAEMSRDWAPIMDELERDRSVRVAVLTGIGSSFCSGADLSWFDSASAGALTVDQIRIRQLPNYRLWLRPRSLPMPVIAAINGPAVGAGVCLALACDLRYASREATFSTPFLQIGTHAGMGATWLLTQAIGESRTREMIYTGRTLAPDLAHDWGLVNGVADDALVHSLEVAGKIAEAAPIATRLTKVGLGQATAGLEAALQWEALAQPVTMTTSDMREGVRARLEHRRPHFDGT
jgi:enoyl-CoA hydratase/carnithine racemase